MKQIFSWYFSNNIYFLVIISIFFWSGLFKVYLFFSPSSSMMTLNLIWLGFLKKLFDIQLLLYILWLGAWVGAGAIMEAGAKSELGEMTIGVVISPRHNCDCLIS